MTSVFVSVERAMGKVVVLAKNRLKFITERFPRHAAREDVHVADAITPHPVCRFLLQQHVQRGSAGRNSKS
jgi:hypothetical protein